MRVVVDTNVVISGLFWRGAPRPLLNAARAQLIDLYTSPVLLAELSDVLHRGKFAERLAAIGVKSNDLVMGYAALARVIKPADSISIIIDILTIIQFWNVQLQRMPTQSFQETIIS